jgi:hypothetical protein
MMVPEELKALHPPPISRAALPSMPPPPPRPSMPEPPIEVRRRNPERDVRAFPIYSPQARVANRPFAPAPVPYRTPAHELPMIRAWWEDPIALGSLLILCPPIGLAAVWSSKRYSTDARWALTVMTALMMCLVSAVVIALVAMR